MGFDLGVNTRPMNPPKLLPGFCWSRFQVGAAQQGFSFTTCYYPMVGTWGLLAPKVRTSERLVSATLCCHHLLTGLRCIPWMQMEGFFRVKHGWIWLNDLVQHMENMSFDSSSSGEFGRSHPLLRVIVAGHPEARIPRVGDGKLQGWGPDGSYKQPNGKQRRGSRFRSHCLAETAGAMGITSIRLPPASTHGHVRAALSCKAKHGWVGLKLGQMDLLQDRDMDERWWKYILYVYIYIRMYIIASRWCIMYLSYTDASCLPQS